MSVLGFIGSGLGSIVSGGLTGLFGAAINTVGEYLKTKEQNRHEEVMETYRIQELEKQGEIKQNIAETEAFKESYGNDRATYFTGVPGKIEGFMLALVDLFRGFTRPAATWYLLGLTTWITVMAWQVARALEIPLSTDQVYTILYDVVLIVMYLTVTAVAWWFGTRQKIMSKVSLRLPK